ncbi:MAG: EAL domain-containing protein [Sulfurospirillum sp.]|nr:EAL domain-containing protein [Sulfurospirillum sp.]
MRFFSYIFVLLALFFNTVLAKEHYTIGILSFRSPEVTLKQWQPLIDYLENKQANYSFTLKPLSFVELDVAIKNQTIDFLLTNPISYILFKEKNLVNIALLSMKELKDGKVLDQFGGVIFTHKDSKDINTLADLKGKKIATVGTNSLGGYQVQAYELFKIGTDVIKDTKLIFTELPHDNTVFEVLNKKADVGFVRTSVLEALVKEKKIHLSDFKILNIQQKEDFPFLLSTDLYPQWPLTSLLHVNKKVAQELSVLLLSLPDMQVYGLGGFGVAQDYARVKQILQSMHFLHSDEHKNSEIFEFFDTYIDRYLYELILFTTLLFIFIVFIAYQLRLANKKLKAHQNALVKFEKIFNNTAQAIILTDVNTVITDVNPAFCVITGYSKAEAIGNTTNLLQSGKHDKTFYESMWKDLRTKGFWEGEIYNKRKNTQVYPEYLSINALKDEQDNINAYIALFSDITAIKSQQKALEQMAYFDTLTKLPNRRKLVKTLEQLMSKQTPFVFLLIDLDDFKLFNEKFRREIGDKFLLAFAQRLQNVLKKTDFLARIGGDEFAIIWHSEEREVTCEAFLEQLLHISIQTLSIDAQSVSSSVSIGVSFYPQEAILSPEKLIRQSDQAMYNAKMSGKNQYKFFDTNTEKQLQTFHKDIQQIHNALISQEFLVYYQPKVNMHTGEVLGFEALVRWQRDEQIISPAFFLPLIENHSLMMELGEYVLKDALDLLASWHNTERQNQSISVNLSAYQVLHEDFIPRLQAILQQYPQLDLHFLEFEILETSALEDITAASQVIATCKQMGISFSLDDFGTGYSSLTYLKRLDIQTIKIDQSFVRELFLKAENIDILDAIIALANSFNIKVIAEGVEDISQGRILLHLGCDNAQGYFIAKPMPKEQIPAWQSNWQTPPQWSKTKKIKHENISILRVVMEHFAWIDKIELYIKDMNDILPPLHHKECKFARIIENDSNLKSFLQPVLPQHKKIHMLAQELIGLHNAGFKVDASKKIQELLALAQNMQEDIYDLLQVNS